MDKKVDQPTTKNSKTESAVFLNYFFEYSVYILFITMMSLHLWTCPYTKVEESFNVQAMHDWIFHKFDIQSYDHLQFPGVVPRSFLGAVVISSIAYPYTQLALALGFEKTACLLIVRFFLGLFVTISMIRLQVTIKHEIGSLTSMWFLIITASQFHFMFYLTRPIPNTFALILVLEAYRHFILNQNVPFIYLSAFVIIVFRAELCILLGILCLFKLLSRELSFKTFMVHSILSGALSLSSTVLIDSFFWQRWLWPEGEVLWYNTVMNKSSNWGTQPFMWYFYSALPRGLLFSTVPALLGFRDQKTVKKLMFAATAFVFLYSFLPHKELRFIVYVFPIFNLSAAVMSARWTCYPAANSKLKLMDTMKYMAANNHIVMNTLVAGLFLYISSFNYPGGDAMLRLNQLTFDEPVNLHIDVTSAQTGITRFLEIQPNWIYNKSENLSAGDKLVFSHLLEGIDEDRKNLDVYRQTHTILDIIYGFSHIKFDFNETIDFFQILRKFQFQDFQKLTQKSLIPIQIFQKPCIVILKRLRDVEVNVLEFDPIANTKQI